MKKYGIGLCLLLCACIKPAPDETKLGEEVSYSEISAAVFKAQEGIDENSAFRVGDSGTILIVDKVLANSRIQQTHQWEVNSIDNQKVVVYGYHVEKKQQYAFEIKKKNNTQVAKLLKWKVPSLLPDSLLPYYLRLAKLSSSIQVELSSAVGAPEETHAINHPLVNSKTLKAAGVYTQANPQSKYYGLTVVKHKIPTGNQSQIPDGLINSTRIEYNEITKDENGEPLRLHKSLEISNEVPGIFTLLNDFLQQTPVTMEYCVSALLEDGKDHVPYTNCWQVPTFFFGNNQAP